MKEEDDDEVVFYPKKDIPYYDSRIVDYTIPITFFDNVCCDNNK